MSYYRPQKEVQLEFNDDNEIPTLRYNHQDKPRELNKATSKKKYEDNTFIDWYMETMLIPRDHSSLYKKWICIILTSIISGYVVTLIDLSSVWLNDLRKGLCLSKLDKWSLLSPYLTCPTDYWKNWSEIIFDSKSFFSGVFVDFPFYVIFGSFWVILAVYISQKDLSIQQSGIPEVKEIIQGFNYDLDNYLGLRTLLLKIFGLTLVVSSGLWLGKEGPLVHVACCIINVLYNFVFGKTKSNEAVRRELLSAATATGISLAFNSPIGGVLFVLECIPSYFIPTKIMWNSFISATVSLVILVGFKLFAEGDDFNEKDLFSVEFGNFSWLMLELIPFVGLGLLGALYGHYFIKLYSKFQSKNFRKSIQFRLCTLLKINPEKGNYVEILTIFILTCLLNFPVTITRLPLNALLKILFTDCSKEGNETIDNSTDFMCHPSDIINFIKLFYIAFQAFLLSSYTFGTILPGGVLMPSLVIGAVCGRFVGIISKFIQSSLFGNLSTCTQSSCLVSPSAYAVIGAGAFMTGITKLAMCVVVILFELTGAVTYVLPIMISVMVLKFFNDYLCNENIYDAWLKYSFNHFANSDLMKYNSGKGSGLCNFSNSTPKVRSKLPEITVSKVMIPVSETKCLYLIPDEQYPYTLRSLEQFLHTDNHEGYPLLASPNNPISLGYIYKLMLDTTLSEASFNEDSIISFQMADLSTELLSQQMNYEQKVEASKLVRLEVIPEKPFIIMNDQTSFTLLLDTFEKMYLNYAVITDSTTNTTNVMSGFIDRFLISKLIDEGFSSLQDEQETNDHYLQQFDIEAGDDSNGHLLGEMRERHSIELIT